MVKKGKKRFCISIDEDLYNFVCKVSSEKKESKSDFIVRCIKIFSMLVTISFLGTNSVKK